MNHPCPEVAAVLNLLDAAEAHGQRSISTHDIRRVIETALKELEQ